MMGVIADDLTGAAELGAVGLRHGLRAEVLVLGSESRLQAARRWKPAGTPNVDLVCVDTDSRLHTPKEAARRAASAAKLLRKSGASWIYKKVDSVLRGHVTAELEAVMKQLRFDRALLAPANPSLGRMIHDGKYFIRGKPIHKTEFGRDPQFPRRSPLVLELLQASQTFPIFVRKPSEQLPERGIVVAEAASAHNVKQWAARRDPKMLLAGGAEFFGALLAADTSLKPVLPAENVSSGGNTRELFVSGTPSMAARRFAAAARRNKTPVFSLPLDLAWGAKFLPAVSRAIAQRIVAAFGSHSRVVLTVGLPPVRDSLASEKLSDYVVQIAASVLRRVEVGRLFAEGGTTAAALVQRLDWKRLTVMEELAPGVATLAIEGKNLLLTIKPGSYAWPAKWT